MKLCAHDVVIVSGNDANAVARLPVPDANGLVIGAAQNPRILVMEKGGANVVQMAEQREEAPALLVVPHFDLVESKDGFTYSVSDNKKVTELLRSPARIIQNNIRFKSECKIYRYTV